MDMLNTGPVPPGGHASVMVVALGLLVLAANNRQQRHDMGERCLRLGGH